MLGPIIGPAPFSPYAKSEGTISFHFDPTVINCNASVQPLITPPTGNLAVCPLSTELSKTVPSSRVP